MPFVQLKGKILSYDEIDTGKRNKLLVAHFSLEKPESQKNEKTDFFPCRAYI